MKKMPALLVLIVCLCLTAGDADAESVSAPAHADGLRVGDAFASEPYVRLNGQGIPVYALPEEARSVFDLEPFPAPVENTAFTPSSLEFFPEVQDSYTGYSIDLWQKNKSGPELVNSFSMDTKIGPFTRLPYQDGTYGITICRRTNGYMEHGSNQSRFGFLLRVGDGESPPTPAQSSLLPSYFFTILSNQSAALYRLEASLTRDDLGVPVMLDQYTGSLNGRDCISLLAKLDLVPHRSMQDAAPLPVEKPFTISLKFGNRADVFRFSADGVLVNGLLCDVRNPDALASFYEKDMASLGYLLSAKLYSLGDILEFGAGDLKEIDVDYGGGGSFMHQFRITNPASFPQILGMVSREAYRKPYYPNDVKWDPLFTGNSSSWIGYDFHLKDGTVRRISYCAGRCYYSGPLWPSGDDEMGQVGIRNPFFQEFTNRLENPSHLPALELSVNGQFAGKGRVWNYNWDGISFERIASMAQDFSATSIPERGEAVCTFAFSDPLGNLVQPDSLHLEITRKLFDWGEPNLTIVRDTELDTVFLPGAPGVYKLLIAAAFPEGTVEYHVSYRVSSIPERFSTFSHSDSEHHVTLFRDGMEPISGLEDYPFQCFLRDLCLSPDVQSSLPVEQPFTIRFSGEGRQLDFEVSKDGVRVDRRLYGALHPETAASLYQPYSFQKQIYIPNYQSLDDILGGFLSNPPEAVTESSANTSYG